MRTRITIVSLLFAALPCLAATPEELRKAGPAVMEAALAQGASGEALDRICGVRDCADIRLFWYTDLEAAKKQARAEGKPILSLRLLGRLDEEFSCANSRYFRTVYYKNREINDLLRERFVLHWRSVRPVPKVTIDFGDGNRLERTLTGNSIHYVLDSRGRLVDALPGLSGPEAFRRALKEAESGARLAAMQGDGELVYWRAERSRRHLGERASAFLSELRPSGAAEGPAVVAALVVAEAPTPPIPEPAAPEPRPEETAGETRPARDPWAILQTAPIDRLARSKTAGEWSILDALDIVTDDQIRIIAEARRPRIHLDAASRAFLLRKHGVTDPAEAEQLVDAFETTVAQDEVTNDYLTGPAILEKLRNPEEQNGLDLEAFNEWVYEEVFRAPLSDPWMGLAPEDVYVALPESTRTAAARP